LFIEYLLLVRPTQYFVVDLHGNNVAAQQHMNLWAIQQDAVMDGVEVSCLMTTACAQHSNLNLGITNYQHVATYFGHSIKKDYCIKFPLMKHPTTFQPHLHNIMPIV
jgi:hypothetical protein